MRLLENPLALPVLKALLPKISNRIHDTTEKVRLAFIALLERVSLLEYMNVGLQVSIWS